MAVSCHVICFRYDVIVFPRHGPRPHPDEMAGSDLDGDEYAVFWDDQLMFDKNEPPMDFPHNKNKKIKSGITNDDIVNFFLTSMTSSKIGQVGGRVVSVVCRVLVRGGSRFDPRGGS